jgi:type I restriction enzyme S subunit
VNDGDVLISWSASLGVYVWQGEKALLNQHIFKVVFDKVEVNKSFFVHQVRRVLEEAASSTHGATMKHLTKPVFDALPFYLPSMEEQGQIAKDLDKVDELISLRKKQLQKLDDLINSRFVEMFGDPVANPLGWRKERLVDVCSKLTDGTHFSPESNETGDYKYVTAKNIKKGGFDFSNITYVSEEVHRPIYQRCNPVKGDVLYIKDGATTGIAIVNNLDEEFSLLSSVALLKYKREIVNGYFLCEMLNNNEMYFHIRDLMGGAAITRLTIEKLNNIVLIVPPINLQEQFANYNSHVYNMKMIVWQGIDKLDQIKQALMQKYFG